MDDEEAIRTALRRVLPVLGYHVDFAGNGKEAINLFQKSVEEGNNYEAVILDLTIPGGMGGKDVIARMLTMKSDVKAIASSGYCDDPVIANYRSYGFNGYLTKPYDIKELSSALHEVIVGDGAVESSHSSGEKNP